MAAIPSLPTHEPDQELDRHRRMLAILDAIEKTKPSLSPDDPAFIAALDDPEQE